MTKEKLKQKVDEIIEIGWDPEAAHSEEDKLYLKLIQKFCPLYVKKEIKRLLNADFPRWCS